MKVPRFNFFPVKEYHALPEAYAEATRLIEKATKEVDAFYARLAAAEAVCRAAQETYNSFPHLNPKAIGRLGKALAAWEAACKGEQP